MTLRDEISRIGRNMAICDACGKRSVDVNVESTDVYPPRGLMLERADAPGEGCIVAGINPGRADQKELRFYARKSAAERRAYETQIAFFEEVRGDYYSNLRRLIGEFGITGPILWTDVVKCETPEDEKKLPNRPVIDRCTESFLVHELRAVPASWPVIAAGEAAWEVMQKLARHRVVLGVPHPSNQHSKRLFERLLGPSERALLKRASKALRVQPPFAAWIPISRPPKGG